MTSAEYLLQSSGSTYPPVFIAAVGYIMYRFVYTETKNNKKGEASPRGKWLAFLAAQVIIVILAVGEWGESTFIPTVAAVLLECLACFLAWFFATKASDKSK